VSDILISTIGQSHFRRKVTHYELFISVDALVKASYDFFERLNQHPHEVLSIIFSDFALLMPLYQDAL
jgi:hypothetical protein